MFQGSIAYRVTTGLFCLAFILGGAAHLFRAEAIVEGMAHLGYPIYVTSILGTAKLLGAVALLAPGWALLKEWAYAGFAFDLTGAVASHVFMGDAVGEIAPPAALLLLGAASYLLRPDALRPGAGPASESTTPGR